MRSGALGNGLVKNIISLKATLPLLAAMLCHQAFGNPDAPDPHPTLAITSHADLQLVQGPTITLAGTASDSGHGNSGIIRVTVNAVRAVGDTAAAGDTATWSRTMTLKQGVNTLKAVATDGQRNSTTNTLRIDIDSTAPVQVITYPAVGQRVTTPTIIAKGKVSDKHPARVWLQLNDDPWIQPTGTTNWTATLSLTPGTNMLQAFADDALGNRSKTNRVRFTYVVYAAMQVQVSKGGSVTPNHNGKNLEVGKRYSMSASATTGYKFQAWTNPSGNVITNRPTVSFTMTPDLALNAVFADVQKPSVTIQTPAAAAKLTNSPLLAGGTAKDNTGVQAVYYQLNSGDWAQASGTTQWSFQAEMDPGPNTLSVFAVDTAGIRSSTNRVSVTFLKDIMKTFWPMHDGDNKTYSGPVGTASVYFSGDDLWGYTLDLEAAQDDTKSYYKYSSDYKQLILTGGTYNWTTASFNPPVVELTENQLINGGSRQTITTLWMSGQKCPSTVTTSVSMAGTVTVPAGTYRNCRRINVNTTVTVDGQKNSASAGAYILAPKVGMIKIGIYKGTADGDFTFLGWEQLTGGTVDGVDVRGLASPSLTKSALSTPEIAEAESEPEVNAQLEYAEDSQGQTTLVVIGEPGQSCSVETRTGQDQSWEPFWVGIIRGGGRVALPLNPGQSHGVEYRVR